MTAVAAALTDARLADPCSRPLASGATRTSLGYANGKNDYPAAAQDRGPGTRLGEDDRSDTWCSDVVIQVASATRALQGVAVGLLNDHLRHCVSNAVGKTGADGDQLLAEVAGTIRQVVQL